MHYLYFSFLYVISVLYILLGLITLLIKRTGKAITSIIMGIANLIVGGLVISFANVAFMVLIYPIWAIAFGLFAYFDYKDERYKSALNNTILTAISATLTLIILWFPVIL